MPPEPSKPLVEPVQWSADGAPCSARFGDVYRSRSGALAQAQTVFLGGCQLPAAWQGRDGFTVLETGFGLGLNFLATWDAWARDALRCRRLHYLAIEAYPVAAAELVRSAQSCVAQGALPADRCVHWMARAHALAAAWDKLVAGVQTVALAHGQVQLTLAVGDVLPMLARLLDAGSGVDAVYLDGFSPARNPRMWSVQTLAAVARLCRPDTSLATYTAAGAVRSALRQVGFAVRRRPGLPPKWHRLEARFVGRDAGDGAPARDHMPA